MAQRAARDRFAAAGRPIYCGGRTRRLVALTFDDGPGPYTPLALRKLRAAHAPATFFLVGKEIAEHRHLPALERTQGTLGDHTWTHPYLPALGAATAQAEIARTQQTVAAAGRSPVRLFRPPYGARTPAIDNAAGALGMAEILWDVDTGDSEGAGYAGIAGKVRREVRPGSIVLMHENRGQTIRALDHVLQTLRDKRLTPVTVPELLAADPPVARPARRRPTGVRCLSRRRQRGSLGGVAPRRAAASCWFVAAPYRRSSECALTAGSGVPFPAEGCSSRMSKPHMSHSSALAASSW